MPVKVTSYGSIRQYVISSPERKNALSLPILDELERLFTDVSASDSRGSPADSANSDNPPVTGVIITGNAQIFSAGADFNDLNGDVRDISYDDRVAAVTAAIRDAAVPVVAAIEGACMGAAVDIALSCDLRVAGATAFVQVPAVKLGILYNPEAIARWKTEFSRSTLNQLLMFGTRLPANDAQRHGIIDTVTADGEALAAAHEALARIRPGQLDALAATKAIINSATDTDPVDWQKRRTTLLSSQHRKQAIERAKSGQHN